jgi:succinate dehydrogenase / fumarate reductase, cytochrome b subunit
MNSSKIYLSSSIGRKFLVAVTGLMMCGFLFAHLGGNLLIFAGSQALNEYAEGLRKFPAILNALRAGLIVAALAHIFFAVRLNMENKAARPVAYASKKFLRATFASKHMVLTGLLLLFYILFHLGHLTFRFVNNDFAHLGPYQVYEMLQITFKNPAMVGIYCAASIVLGLHLSHGLTSLFQTLGLNSKKSGPMIEKIGPIVGWALAVLYMSIPLSVFFGCVK